MNNKSGDRFFRIVRANLLKQVHSMPLQIKMYRGTNGPEKIITVFIKIILRFYACTVFHCYDGIIDTYLVTVQNI